MKPAGAHGANALRGETVPSAAVRSRALDYLALTKPRLNLLVLFTTWGGVFLASPGGVALATLLHTLVGTALVAGGAAALNQVLERHTDALMRRTRGRPLPDGRLTVSESAAFGLLISAAGLVELAAGVNGVAAVVAALTLVSY